MHIARGSAAGPRRGHLSLGWVLRAVSLGWVLHCYPVTPSMATVCVSLSVGHASCSLAMVQPSQGSERTECKLLLKVGASVQASGPSIA